MDKYNDENLEEFNEAKWQLLTTSFKTNKELIKVKAIADLIMSTHADLILLTEVGGHESLKNFSHHFLENRFDIIHYDSNSDRGIDLAALISPKLNYKSKFHNHSCFARGVLEICLEINNFNLHIFHTHLKSKLNLKGKDFEGRAQREKEVNKVVEIIKQKNSNHIILTGDFNGIIYQDNTEKELAAFDNKLGLKDAFEHLKSPFFDRWTYLYYNKQNDGIFMQLDYCLLTETLAKNLDKDQTMVLDFEGSKRTHFAKNKLEKNTYPSDHYPIQVQLNF